MVENKIHGNQNVENDRRLLLLAALISLTQFAFLYRFFPLMINGDDYMTELALSGAYNGTRLTLYPYNNLLLIKAVSILYSISEAFPFYSVFLAFLLYISCVVIHYSFFCALKKKQYPIWIAEIIYLLFFYGYILPSSIAISYTLVAGICGCSAVSLILSSDYSEKCFRLKSGFAILLSVLACIIRPESGYVPLCFLLLSYAFAVLNDCDSNGFKLKKKHIISIVLFFSVTFVAVLSCSYIDKKLRDDPNAEFISDWNKARSIIVDFQGLTYEKDSDFLNSIGWNKEFYDLEETFYNLDDKCDYSHYSAIQHHYESKQDLPLFAVIRNTISTLLSFAGSIYFAPFFGIILVAFIYFLRNVVNIGMQRCRLVTIYIICAFGGVMLMWIYLSYIGRFVGHVFRLTILSFAVCLFFAAISVTEKTEKIFFGKTNTCGNIMAALFFALPIISGIVQIKSCMVGQGINKLVFICFSIAIFLPFLLHFLCFQRKEECVKLF